MLVAALLTQIHVYSQHLIERIMQAVWLEWALWSSPAWCTVLLPLRYRLRYRCCWWLCRTDVGSCATPGGRSALVRGDSCPAVHGCVHPVDCAICSTETKRYDTTTCHCTHEEKLVLYQFPLKSTIFLRRSWMWFTNEKKYWLIWSTHYAVAQSAADLLLIAVSLSKIYRAQRKSLWLQ